MQHTDIFRHTRFLGGTGITKDETDLIDKDFGTTFSKNPIDPLYPIDPCAPFTLFVVEKFIGKQIAAFKVIFIENS